MEQWQVVVSGVVGVASSNDGQSVLLVFHGVARDEVVRLVDKAWNREKLWPFAKWRASVDFSVLELATGGYRVVIHGHAE